MPLFKATNIVPSSFAGKGSDVIDCNKIVLVSWRLDGTDPLYAYKYRIMENTIEAKEVFNSGKVNLSKAIDVINYRGERKYFEFQYTPTNLMSNGFDSGYKSEITQWWSNNDSDNIVQDSPSYFITRTTPNITIDMFVNPLVTRIQEFTATYIQLEKTRLNWFRWILTNDKENANVIADTGNINNSNDIKFIYDGFFTNQDYYLKLMIETQDGIAIETEWIKIEVDYKFEKIINVLKACPASKKNAIEVDWSKLVIIIGEFLNGNYSYLNHIPVFGHNSILLGDGNTVTFDKVTGRPMKLEPMLNYIWSGCFADKEYSPIQIYGIDVDGNNVKISIDYSLNNKKGIICEISILEPQFIGNESLIFGIPLNENYEFFYNTPDYKKTSIFIDKNNSITFDKKGNSDIKFPMGINYIWSGRLIDRGTILEVVGVDNFDVQHILEVVYTVNSEIIHYGLLPDTTLLPDVDLLPDCDVFKHTSIIDIILDGNILFNKKYETINIESHLSQLSDSTNIVITLESTIVTLFDNGLMKDLEIQNHANIALKIGYTTSVKLEGKQLCDYIWLLESPIETNMLFELTTNISYVPILNDKTAMLCLFNGIMNVTLATISMILNGAVMFEASLLHPSDENPDVKWSDKSWWTIVITSNKIHVNWFEKINDDYVYRDSVIGEYDLYFTNTIYGGESLNLFIDNVVDGGRAFNPNVTKDIYGGNAYTVDYFYTTKIVLEGEQKCDYFWITKNSLTEYDLEQIRTNLYFEPEWDLETLLLAKFNYNLSAGNAFNEFDILIGVFIYRFDYLDNTFNLIGEKDLYMQKLLDYTALSQHKYCYYMFPIGNKTFGQPVVSNIIEPVFWDYSILDCVEVSNNKFEVVEEFIFSANVTTGEMSNNSKHNYMQNFTPYPKQQITNSNYMSGSLTGLTGIVENGKYADSIEHWKKLNKISTNNNHKFLKSRKGNMWKIYLPTGVSTKVIDNTYEQVFSATVNWQESGTMQSIVVTGGDEIGK